MEERDPHYLSVLGTRKRALSQLSPSVEDDKGVDKKVAEAVRDLVEAPCFTEMLVDLCDAFGKGFSCVELVWDEDGGKWKPAYVWRDPKYFTFDYNSRQEVRLQRLGTLDGDALETGKWIVHTPNIKSGIPIRGGFARIAAWVYLFKNYSLKDWASASSTSTACPFASANIILPPRRTNGASCCRRSCRSPRTPPRSSPSRC